MVPIVETYPVSAYRHTSATVKSTSASTNKFGSSYSVVIMPRYVGPPFRTAVTRIPGEVLDHRTGRDVDELSLLNPPMNVSMYTSMGGSVNKTLLDIYRCN